MELKERDDIKTVMDLYHLSLLGGHSGRDRMIKTISKFFKWEGMTKDIGEYVKACPICEKTKTTTHTKIPMQISTEAQTPFQIVYIDYVGPIAPSKKRHKY